jgi:acetyl esterase/lipase
MAAPFIRDVTFRETGDRPLKLDVYRPDGAGPHPVLVWVCGGGMVSLERDLAQELAGWIVERGFAVVAIEYRVTSEAIFPAQIHDVKAAVRWVRAHANDYGFDPERLGAWGDSAGGYLASLLGTSAGKEDFGAAEPWRGHSDRVRAVCAYCPPTDLANWPNPQKAVYKLLGGWPAEKPDVARWASTTTYVGPDSPPHLLVHAEEDDVVPLAQSRRLAEALEAAGVEVDLYVVRGAAHGGPALAAGESEIRTRVAGFFERHMGHT